MALKKIAATFLLFIVINIFSEATAKKAKSSDPENSGLSEGLENVVQDFVKQTGELAQDLFEGRLLQDPKKLVTDAVDGAEKVFSDIPFDAILEDGVDAVVNLFDQNKKSGNKNSENKNAENKNAEKSSAANENAENEKSENKNAENKTSENSSEKKNADNKNAELKKKIGRLIVDTIINVVKGIEKLRGKDPITDLVPLMFGGGGNKKNSSDKNDIFQEIGQELEQLVFKAGLAVLKTGEKLQGSKNPLLDLARKFLDSSEEDDN